jgi:hypothetical protein
MAIHATRGRGGQGLKTSSPAQPKFIWQSPCDLEPRDRVLAHAFVQFWVFIQSVMNVLVISAYF